MIFGKTLKGKIFIRFQEVERHWLDPELTIADAIEMIQPYESNLMMAYPVSTEVNHVKSNHSGLIKEINTENTLF